MRFGLAVLGVAALLVIMPVRSEAKKNRDMLASQMTTKLPKAEKALRVHNGKIRVRKGLAVTGKPLSIMKRRPMDNTPDSEVMDSTFGKRKSMQPTIKLPRIKPPKNQRPEFFRQK